MMRKIFDLSGIKVKLKEASKKKIVLTGGVFDFLNPLHIDLFDLSKKRGDILVVAVNSADNYTPVEERLEILEAVENIDLIIAYSKTDELKDITCLVTEIIFNDDFEYSSEDISFYGNSITFRP